MATNAQPLRNAVLPAHVQVTADIAAPRVGAAPPVIEQRAGDRRPYVIDLQPVLRPGELVQGVEGVSPAAGVQRARSYYGTYIELTLGDFGGDPATAPVEHRLVATVTTSQGSVRVPFVVRVHPSF